MNILLTAMNISRTSRRNENELSVVSREQRTNFVGDRRMKNHSILILVIMALWVVSATKAKYSGGTGEPNDPYRIASAEDLNDIGNYEEDWDKYFVLINDVNLAGYTGAQFNRIGMDWQKPFVGIFDGNNCKIWNFAWDSNGINCVGLFEYVGNGGQIKNLGMINVDVNAVNGYFVGGLVGKNWRGTITNCYSTGSFSGLQDVGGLVGYNQGAMINCCLLSGSISGFRDVGGLVGINYGTINNCYSTDNVSGNLSVGGLVGLNYGTINNCYSIASVSGGGTGWSIGGLLGFNDGEIIDCYSTGSVDGNSLVGGLAGHNCEDGVIRDCYSTGSVDGNDYVGGLVGNTCMSSGSITASFWDTQTSGISWSAGGESKTTAEMKKISTFASAGWDFIEIWDIRENQTYPFLRTDPAGDLNHDRMVNLIDLAILAESWLQIKNSP